MRIFKVVIILVQVAVLQAGYLGQLLQQSRASAAYYAGDAIGAQHVFEQLVTEDSNNSAYVQGLADSFYAQGNYKQAAAYYQRALINTFSKKDQERLLFNVGCAQAQLREFEKALTSFQQVVVLNNNNKRAQKNIEILKKLLEQQKQQQNKQDDKNNRQQNKQNRSSDDQKNQSKSNEQPKDNNDQKENKENNSEQCNRDQQEHERNQEQQKKSKGFLI